MKMIESTIANGEVKKEEKKNLLGSASEACRVMIIGRSRDCLGRSRGGEVSAELGSRVTVLIRRGPVPTGRAAVPSSWSVVFFFFW